MHIWAPEQLTELILCPTFEALQRNYAFARQHIILQSSKLFACQFSSAETLPQCIFALSGEPLVCQSVFMLGERPLLHGAACWHPSILVLHLSTLL